MGMAVPKNSIPMLGTKGPHDYITMGGMFTILKVREGIQSYADPGWYNAPAGTQADVAAADALKRDAIEVKKFFPKNAAYSCPMHSEVISKTPGKCPKCGMTLTKK
jgi:hypothetical protein